ncbi:MAG: adenylyl-sulfate kinase [Planctomycetota bacterium]|nr:MAG: adenylyl-sulfate kinase [Planctomycetota bacterium]
MTDPAATAPQTGPLVGAAPRQAALHPARAGELVRVVVLGHVDHGKSTLLGRLLHDTGNLPEGRLEQIRAVSARRGLDLEWAFALDALQAERDQGITIDAAHVWLRTPARSYAFIDAPGHEEFIRNMISGAARADAALLVVSAPEGIGAQTRQHAYLLRLLGVEQVAVVLTKMDLVDYREEVYRRLGTEIEAYLGALGIAPAGLVPVAAREGTHVVGRQGRGLGWYQGPTVLQLLAGLRPQLAPAAAPLRLPLQDVYRFDERRLLAGRIESGVLRVGDELVFSPWNKVGFVRSIERWGPREQQRPYAVAGESVAITLEQQLYVERGQIASHLVEAPVETDVFEATVFWLGHEPLPVGGELVLRLATQQVQARLAALHRLVDLEQRSERRAEAIGRHQIAEVTIRTRHPIAVDDHRRLPATGRFVLVQDGLIAGGGTVRLGAHPDLRPQLSGLKSTHITRTAGRVSRAERARRTGHYGRVLWFTGLSGAGKSTISIALERRLFDLGYLVYRLDGDNLRHGLSADLGFSVADRRAHVRRVGEVAKLLCDAGLVVIAALISPYAEDREHIRRSLREREFIEIFADCPLEVCEARDAKGLYRAARQGRLHGFTGIDAPYEPPRAPEIVLRTDQLSVEACVERIVEYLRGLEAAEIGR